MSFEERNTWVFLVIAIVAYACYVTIVLVSAGGRALVEVDYGPVMLSTIGGAIVAGILGTIAISVIWPKGAGKSDQRDKEISRFGDHVGQAFVVIGGVVALLFAIVRVDYFWIANAVYLAFVLSALLGSIAKLVAYRRGFQPW
ncbi:hypothetical protein [Herbiconiux ginsengi]|uniref:DUF2178 domain-containing protein n=1 Tax=Herbiconiux ginsengi TaxID=381665 RepID=A0A1H3PGV2_9MICO|nr:hypothetical protein [Herbiconiux ginsengi]SDZ00297.1 hypothetical protein SAMN05216554_1884 [Herbiconiux ginsengi]